MYTDGSQKKYLCETILSSISVHFGHGHPENMSRIVYEGQDVDEAKGILEALNIVSTNNINKISIYTDSIATIKHNRKKQKTQLQKKRR